jgi:molecular chaperone DnaK
MADHFLGIDLGTTNSVATLLEGDTRVHVRTDDGGFLMPSVVRIDARQTLTVGARARKFLEIDPENTRSEFKRLMGSGRKLAFKSAKIDKTPEELSAYVLGALRDHAATSLGEKPTCAVITVPALFELPQIRATSEAARLAGFDRVEHLQEPVASALTAGYGREDDPSPWFVYDLGGGTFDVSLLETREGVLRVVDHDGDNFLGGRDMDARLLEFVLLALEQTYGRAFKRSDPALGSSIRRLRAACEEAKMELGRGKNTAISLAEPLLVDGDEIIVDVPVDVTTFDALVLPVIDRSVEVCLRLLERQGLETKSVGRMVLVGGPTVMSSLRNRLQERLQILLATDVDPMTAVAEGAAIFAREHALGALTTSAPKKDATPASDVKAVQAWLQYPSVSGDLNPFIVGRLDPERVATVSAKRKDTGKNSVSEKVGDDGTFAVQVDLAPRTTTTFEIVALDKNEKPVPVSPREVTIRHGLSLADPPLSRTIGVALADGGVAVYFERGAPLPSRKTFRLRTSVTVHPGETASLLSVPIVQGDAPLAHLCRLVGRIEIKPDALKEPLVAGSPVDIVLELDRGGKLTATAEIPSISISFPGTLHLVSPDSSLEELEEQLARLRKKTEALYVSKFVADDLRNELVAVDGRLDEADREAEAARGADPDGIEKLRRLLVDIDEMLAEVEAKKAWPELEQRAMNRIAFAVHWVSRNGTPMERQLLEESLKSVDRARAVRNAADFERRLSNVLKIGEAAWLRDNGELVNFFRSMAQRISEMRDPREANKLVAKGEAAIAARNFDEVRSTAYALFEGLPPEQQTRARAHGSGVER